MPSSPRPSLLLALSALLIAAAYQPSLGGGFVWDDHTLIEGQQVVQRLASPATYFGRMFFVDPEEGEHGRNFYRPLVTLSFALDWAVGAGSPFPFRLTNLLFHLLMALLVALLCRKLGCRWVTAVLIGTLYGLMPRLAESAAWISGRTDVLAGVGAVGALLLYSPDPERSSRRWWSAAALLFGLLSKEVAFAAVLALVVCELIPVLQKKASLRPVLFRLLPISVSVLLYFGARLAAHADQASTVGLPFTQRLVLGVQAAGTYAWMVLNPFQPRTVIGVLGLVEPIWVAIGVAVICLGVAGAVHSLRKPPTRSLLPFALAVFAILPVLHLVPLAVNVVAADRFLYLPLAGLLVGLAVVVDSARSNAVRKAGLCVGLALIPVLFLGTHDRALDWAHEFRLWNKAAETASALNGLPYGALAELHLKANREDKALSALQEAERREVALHQKTGVRLRQEHENLLGVALCHTRMGHYEEARSLLQSLLLKAPRTRRLHFNYALNEARALRFENAQAELSRARALFPGDRTIDELELLFRKSAAELSALPAPAASETVEVARKRAAVYAQLGKLAEARTLYARIASDPAAETQDREEALFFALLHEPLEIAEERFARTRVTDPQLDSLAAIEVALEERRHRESLS